MPSAKVIELTVTVLPVPTFLLSKVEVFKEVSVSVPIKPVYVTPPVFKVAVVLPSYVLFDVVIPETDKDLAVTFAVEV